MKKSMVVVFPGDTVVVTGFSEKDSRTAVVLEVTKRYGKASGGRHAVAPLLSVKYADGETGYIDNGFVISVVKRSNAPHKKTNIYRTRRPMNSALVEHKGAVKKVGHLEILFELALSKLPYEIDREVDFKKLVATYKKDGSPGLVWFEDLVGFTQECHHVNWKRFTKWARKNYNRLLVTTKELHALETRKNNEYAKQYFQSLQALEEEMQHAEQ